MPIDYTQAPDADDVESLLSGAEYWPEDAGLQAFATTQAAINAAAAVAEFEKRTGWKPFVNSGDTATTRYFTAADYDGILPLRSGLLSLSSVAVNGVARTLNENLFLLPVNATDEGQPFYEVQFYPASMVYPGGMTSPRAIAVTGVWGRFSEWPPDAWQAVLYKAGIETLTGIQTEQTTLSISEDGFSQSLDPVETITPGQHLREDWRKAFDQAVMRYKRVVV